MENENVRIAEIHEAGGKLAVAAGLLTANNGQKWEGALGEAVEAAAKYVKKVLES